MTRFVTKKLSSVFWQRDFSEFQKCHETWFFFVMDRVFFCVRQNRPLPKVLYLEAYHRVVTSLYRSLPRCCHLEIYQACQPSITPRWGQGSGKGSTATQKKKGTSIRPPQESNPWSYNGAQLFLLKERFAHILGHHGRARSCRRTSAHRGEAPPV